MLDFEEEFDRFVWLSAEVLFAKHLAFALDFEEESLKDPAFVLLGPLDFERDLSIHRASCWSCEPSSLVDTTTSYCRGDIKHEYEGFCWSY